MSCTTLTAITKGCDNNIGGITAIYINDMDNITSTTIDSATYMVDAQVVSSNYEAFEFRRNTGNFTEETAVDFANGSSFVTATVTLMFHRREASKSKAIKILSEGQRDLAIIVKDANGNYLKPEVKEFFATSIDESGCLLSEDYHFCELHRKHGGKIHANPFIKLEHVGTYVYGGDIIKAGGNLK